MRALRLFNHAGPTSDDWYTPPWIFDGLGLTFDLDVASPPGGVPWIPAARFFDIDDNGLAQEWSGLVWCNPPYSAPAQWCDKWALHPDGLILIRADLSLRGPLAAFAAADAVHFTAGRLQFIDYEGNTRGAVAFSTVLLARGERAVVSLERLEEKSGGCTRTLDRLPIRGKVVSQ